MLGALICWLIILVLSLDFDDHIVKQHGSEMLVTPQAQVCFGDVNGDGFDEIIVFRQYKEHSLRLDNFVIKDMSMGDAHLTLEQTNLNELSLTKKKGFVLDYDRNGSSEIFAVDVVNDSLILRMFEFDTIQNAYPQIPKFSVYLDTVLRHQGEITCQTDYLDIRSDLNHDGIDEIWFTINNGFPIYPRKNFVLDIVNRKVVSSPTTSASMIIRDTMQADGQMLCTGSSNTIGNDKDSIPYPLTDYRSYVFLFDSDLNWVFDPIPHDSFPSAVDALFYDGNIVALKEGISGNYIERRDLKGNLLKTRLLTPTERFRMLETADEVYVMGFDKVYRLHDSLDLLPVWTNDVCKLPYHQIDLDQDGTHELVFIDKFSQEIELFNIISNSSCRFPTGDVSRSIDISTVKLGDEHFFSIAYDNGVVQLYKYGLNPRAWLRYPYYLGIFAISAGLSILLFRLFRKNIEQKVQEETQLIDLQIKAAKNRFDPHFVLGGLSSIDRIYQSGRNEEASDYMVQLMRLMRHVLSSANIIECSLREELELVLAYCKLEKIRSQEIFEFEFEVSEQIDIDAVRVPRHILYTYVENALKHGLRPKKGTRKLAIMINLVDDHFEILVDDDGIGLEGSKKSETRGTGQGLDIQNQIFRLYQKRNGFKSRISADFVEKQGPGTRVRVLIPIVPN